MREDITNENETYNDKVHKVKAYYQPFGLQPMWWRIVNPLDRMDPIA